MALAPVSFEVSHGQLSIAVQHAIKLLLTLKRAAKKKKPSEMTAIMFQDVGELIYQQCSVIQHSLVFPAYTSGRRIQNVAELSDCAQRSKLDPVTSDRKLVSRVKHAFGLKFERHALCELRVSLRVEEMSFSRWSEPRE